MASTETVQASVYLFELVAAVPDRYIVLVIIRHILARATRQTRRANC